MIPFGILAMLAAMAWLWRWLVRHEAGVRLRWARFSAHPRVTALRNRFAPQIAFLRARLSPAGFLGLDLTIGAVILIGGVWIFGGIAEDVATGDPLTVLDREIAAWLHLHATPALTDAMIFVSLLASWPVATGICIFMAAYFIWKRSYYRLLALVLTIPAGMLLTVILKYAFHRSRPAWDDPILLIGSFGFPSGHAMAATLLYGFLAAFIARKVRAWRWRVLVVLAAGMLIVLVGFSRLYLGVHYLTDVLAGMAAGSAWLALCLTAVGTLRHRRGILRQGE
jgi:membrane-associated phospholipid phosphatase